MSGDQHVTFEVMEAYVAHTLPEQGCLAVEEHIADCRQCLKQVQALRGLEPLWQSWTIASHVAATRAVSSTRPTLWENLLALFRERSKWVWLTTGGLATAAACALLIMVAHKELEPSGGGGSGMIASAPPEGLYATRNPRNSVNLGKRALTKETTPLPQQQGQQASNPKPEGWQHRTGGLQHTQHPASRIAGVYMPIRRNERVTAMHSRSSEPLQSDTTERVASVPQAHVQPEPHSPQGTTPEDTPRPTRSRDKPVTELQYLAMLPPQLETRGISPEPKASPDRTVVLSQTPTLTVKDSSSAGPYRFQIDEGQWEGGEFVVTKPEIVKAETDKAEYVVSQPLLRGKIYRWQMTSAQKESPKPLGGTFMVSTERTYAMAWDLEQYALAPESPHYEIRIMPDSRSESDSKWTKLVRFYKEHGLYLDVMNLLNKLLAGKYAIIYTPLPRVRNGRGDERRELLRLKEEIERIWQ